MNAVCQGANVFGGKEGYLEPERQENSHAAVWIRRSAYLRLCTMHMSAVIHSHQNGDHDQGSGMKKGCAGFNISLEPSFSVSRLCFILGYDAIYAVANLRCAASFFLPLPFGILPVQVSSTNA